MAETFYNSLTRRILTTVGVETKLEFVWFGATIILTGNTPIARLYVQDGSLQSTIRSILHDYHFAVPYVDLDGDARQVAEVMAAELPQAWDTSDFDCIEMLESVFYRNKAAYLVGRIRNRNRVLPIILPLLNTDEGIVVDTVLLTRGRGQRGVQLHAFVLPCGGGDSG